MVVWLRWAGAAAVATACGLLPTAARADALAGPYAAEAAANRAVGRIGVVIARIRPAAEAALKQRDVVRLECIQSKLAQAEAAERSATERRSALRDRLFDAPEEAERAVAELDQTAARAEQLATEAEHCVGEEAARVSENRRAYRGGAEVFASRSGSRTEDMKDEIRRSKSRLALLDDTVLAGSATTPAGGHVSAPAGAKGYVSAPAAAPAAPAATAPQPAGSPYAREGAHDASMLIRTADLTLAVFEVDKHLDAVEAAARELGGYLASKSDRQITVRVPRERFDEALKRIEKLGDVLHRNVAAEDVTDQYVDVEMRLKNAYAVRARLEELLKAATVKDAIEIQKELAKTTEEIERLEGKLKLLRDRIGYSTITVTFEHAQPQRSVQNRALLPFPWMNTLGLGPLLSVPR
jgi:hypothetical protein